MTLTTLAFASLWNGICRPYHPGIEASSTVHIRKITTAAKATSVSSILRMLASEVKLLVTPLVRGC